MRLQPRLREARETMEPLTVRGARSGLLSVTVLVGDRTRELAVRALRRHFISGRISADELEDRVDLAVRARSRRDLDVAMDGLPLVWEDLPAGVHRAARHVRRGVRRVTLLIVFVRMWFKMNLALLVALGIALVVGAPAGKTIGAAVAAWALASFAVWYLWRRASDPSTRTARVVARRK
jgi:Domain of unknown function (DUF1707)